jgi:class 3 adenylate cyclase
LSAEDGDPIGQRCPDERGDASPRQRPGGLPAASRGDEYGLVAGQGGMVERQFEATVLFADIRNFTALAEQLGSAEVAELLGAYFEHACRPVLAQGGTNLKFIGDGLMGLFSDDGHEVCAARRALSAAIGLALATHEFGAWVDQRFAGRALPPFAIGIGLHAGEVTLCRFDAGDSPEVTPIGDTVNVAARLEAASKELGWTLVASRAVLQRAGEGVQTQGSASLSLRGRSQLVEVAEVTGLLASAAEQAGGVQPLDASAAPVRTAVEVNAALAAGVPEGSAVTVMTGSRARRTEQ